MDRARPEAASVPALNPSPCVAIPGSAMGGGRRKKGDQIDHAVGLKVHQRIGDSVGKGDPLLTLYCARHRVSEYVDGLQIAVDVADAPVAARPLVLHRQIADV